MASQNDKARCQVTCVVDAPDVADAGAEMTLHAAVTSAPPCDLRGHNLLIKDQTGADLGKLELVNFDGETNETTGEFVAKAPIQPGVYTWSAVCPAIVKKGVSYSETSTPISFTVKPHTMNVVVWDTPAIVVTGGRFRIKVGIKCSGECDLPHKEFR